MEETLERLYDTTPEQVWELWTTSRGIARWWAPDGFAVEVIELDLRPGGTLVYAMTAVGPEQVAFMEGAGLPLRSVSRKTFTTVERPHRLGYRSLIDFVPGAEPYEHLTEIELVAEDGRTRVVMEMEALHDADWTGRLVAGRSNELDNLEAALAG
jgi:uncharacterized protein YndB with AHSA1/START domain